jgi:hypothetical protein
MSRTPHGVRADLTTHIMDKVVQAANDVADLIDIDEEPEGVALLPRGLMLIPRYEADDPAIVEVWL